VLQALQVAKLMKYLSGLRTTTSDKPAAANVEDLANTFGITEYFHRLSGDEVTDAFLTSA